MLRDVKNRRFVLFEVDVVRDLQRPFGAPFDGGGHGDFLGERWIGGLIGVDFLRRLDRVDVLAERFGARGGAYEHRLRKKAGVHQQPAGFVVADEVHRIALDVDAGDVQLHLRQAGNLGGAVDHPNTKDARRIRRSSNRIRGGQAQEGRNP